MQRFGSARTQIIIGAEKCVRQVRGTAQTAPQRLRNILVIRTRRKEQMRWITLQSKLQQRTAKALITLQKSRRIQRIPDKAQPAAAVFIQMSYR